MTSSPQPPSPSKAELRAIFDRHLGLEAFFDGQGHPNCHHRYLVRLPPVRLCRLLFDEAKPVLCDDDRIRFDLYLFHLGNRRYVAITSGEEVVVDPIYYPEDVCSVSR